MAVLTVVGLVLLAKHIGKAAAFPSPVTSLPGTSSSIGECIPVTATAHNHIYNLQHVDSNIDATSWSQDYDGRTSLPLADRIIQNITVSGTYDIHGQLCIPENGHKKDLLQIATHGAGFDSRYWNVRLNPSEYSYVDAALSAGYSILTYDRLEQANPIIQMRIKSFRWQWKPRSSEALPNQHAAARSSTSHSATFPKTAISRTWLQRHSRS